MIASDSLVNEFVFRRTSNGLLIADANGVLAQVNPAATALLDQPADRLIGSTVQRIFANNPALLNLFTRSDDAVLDVRLPRKRLAEGIAATLADGCRIVLLQDVSEQRELDARREAFIAQMAHDLRNPIAALIGFADLIETVGDLNDEQKHFLQRSKDTANKLHDVAAELVDLAWVEAGMPLKHLPIDLKQTIESAIAELTPMAQAKKITIFLSVQDPLPAVIGDPNRIRLVVYKLLHNAILYSGAEQIVAIHAWSSGQEVLCSVADRGIGISAEELEMVFDRLYRSRDERVKVLPGGGIGLTIAKRIVSRHGGDLWGVSELDKGSTFTFRLPAVNAQS